MDDGDEVAADDKGSIFITHEKDGESVTVIVRAPGTTHEAKIYVPAEHWYPMIENGGNWFTHQRELWIAEMLGIYGFINRDHIMRKFGISMPQASIVLRQFKEHHPEAMTYNMTTKRYEART